MQTYAVLFTGGGLVLVNIRCERWIRDQRVGLWYRLRLFASAASTRCKHHAEHSRQTSCPASGLTVLLHGSHAWRASVSFPERFEAFLARRQLHRRMLLLSMVLTVSGRGATGQLVGYFISSIASFKLAPLIYTYHQVEPPSALDEHELRALRLLSQQQRLRACRRLGLWH